MEQQQTPALKSRLGLMLNTKAEIGYLNAMAECPITWYAPLGCWELINEVTGEIFQAPTREALLPLRQREIGYIKHLPYPDIPYGVVIG